MAVQPNPVFREGLTTAAPPMELPPPTDTNVSPAEFTHYVAEYG